MRSATKEQVRSKSEHIIFRHLNKSVQEGFTKLLKIAKEDHQEYLVDLPTGYLLFACECSNRHCSLRIPLKLKCYLRIHRNPHNFSVAPGHMTSKIEELVEHHHKYDVVRERVV